METIIYFGKENDRGFNLDHESDKMEMLERYLKERYLKPTVKRYRRRIVGNLIMDIKNKTSISILMQGKLIDCKKEDQYLVVTREKSKKLKSIQQLSCSYMNSGWDATVTETKFCVGENQFIVIELLKGVDKRLTRRLYILGNNQTVRDEILNRLNRVTDLPERSDAVPMEEETNDEVLFSL